MNGGPPFRYNYAHGSNPAWKDDSRARLLHHLSSNMLAAFFTAARAVVDKDHDDDAYLRPRTHVDAPPTSTAVEDSTKHHRCKPACRKMDGRWRIACHIALTGRLQH
jgi:hypothetical protein